MKSLHIDIETYSSRDLTKCGLYVYTEAPDFEILLFGVSVDEGPVLCYDLARGDRLPTEILDGLLSDEVLKYAFNASFERRCLCVYLGRYLDPHSWRCAMVHALYLGLPGSLRGVGEALNLEKQKLETGRDLIRLFSVPRKPTERNPATRVYPDEEPEKWELYKTYNIRDVETELEIEQRLSRYPVPDFVWQQYVLDQYSNDLGVGIDTDLARQAIRCDELYRDRYLSRARELTGIDNPNSPLRLREWFTAHGVELASLAKADVTEALASCEGEPKEVLELRQLLSRSSVRKYDAMLACTASDGRAHGLLQFYGAARTGRWAGRLVQVQNLPQNHLPDLELARSLVRQGDFDSVELFFDSVPDTLSQLIRTAFVPAPGKKFIVSDYAQVEARCLAWLAGEKWRMEMFARGDDLYCTSASQMFHVPVEKNGVNGHLRQRGKVAELALGYGGGTGAMIAMGASRLGIPEEDLQGIVDAWRASNPAIVSLWWEIDRAALTCLREKKPVELKSLLFTYESGFLFIRLPSGRRLAYPRPRIVRSDFGRDELSYYSCGTGRKWERTNAYGPKLCENIIQAIARDLLAEAIIRLDNHGLATVMHVHDEVILETTSDVKVEDACRIMAETPSWAPGLLLDAAGFECKFYQKD